MKIATALALLVLLSLPPSFAGPPRSFPRMTGQALVDLLAYPPGVINDLQLDERSAINHRIGHGYIDGIHDSTEGLQWCYAGTWKPDTLDAFVIWELRKLTSEALKQKASVLIVDVLRKKFPCPTQPRGES